MRNAYFLMHLAILLWGFTGIFGKAIQMSEGMIVWYRMIISAAGLLPFIIKSREKINTRALLNIAGVGTIVALHWILFYASIKASNVSIALSVFSSISLFTSLIEAMLKGRWPKPAEIILGIAVMVGVYLIFAVQQLYLSGILLAIGSAFLGALFTVLNKTLSQQHNAIVITFYELMTGFVVFSLFLPLYFSLTKTRFEIPSSVDFIYLLLLGLVCTSFAFTISMKALEKLDPFTMNLSVNLEPLYSIILAYLVFGEMEIFNPGFVTGTIVILASVMIHSWYRWRQRIAA